MMSFIIKYRAKFDKIDEKYFFDPWAKNVSMYSWWQLGVHSIPYDLTKKHYRPLSPGVGGRYPRQFYLAKNTMASFRPGGEVPPPPLVTKVCNVFWKVIWYRMHP